MQARFADELRSGVRPPGSYCWRRSDAPANTLVPQEKSVCYQEDH